MIERNASSNETQSSEPALAPHHAVPTRVADEANWWCVDVQYHIYRNSKLLNDKSVMTRTLAVERQVLIGSLRTVSMVHDLFTRHRLKWTVKSVGSYKEDIVKEFYASYI